MYSEQLEQLIKSVIADGVITEKERAVLHKKAAAEGVDEDEIDVYVDGLVAKITPSSMQEPTIDMNYITKYVSIDDDNEKLIYYVGSELYKIPICADGKLVEGYLNFYKRINSFKNENHEKKHSTRLGVRIICVHKVKYFWSFHLTLRTDKNCFELKEDRDISLSIPTNIYSKKHKIDSVTYVIDDEILKMLCDTEQIHLSFGDNEDLLIDDIPITSFITHAQVFYRSIIDNNAYQNALIKQDEMISNNKETDLDDEILKVLTIPKKVMNKVALRHKYFEQFAVKNSDVQFIEFDEKYSLSGVYNCIKVFSILKKEKPQFFLKVIYNYYIVKKDRKGKEETEKKVMHLNSGSLKITCDGYTEVNLSPLVKSKAIFDKDNEMNFYSISEQDMRTILAAENISISIYGSILKSENIRHIGLSTSFPFVWKQAFATLMDEEVPEKKTLFSKLKGLFK